jgi:hypothetical protein
MVAAVGLALVALVSGGAYVLVARGPSPATSAGSGPGTQPPVAGASGATGTTSDIAPTGTTATAPVVGATGASGATPVAGTTGTTTVAAGTSTSQKLPAAPTPAPLVGSSTPKPAATGTATAPTGTTTPAGTTTPTTIRLGSNAASTYDPYGVASASFGTAAKATDGDPLSSWTYKLDPSTAGATRVGLVIDLKSAQHVRTITLTTGSPGMTVEFYGTMGTPPTSITDAAWVHLASRPSIDAQATVPLGAPSRTFDHLLIWITHAPPGVNAGSLSVSDVSVTG